MYDDGTIVYKGNKLLYLFQGRDKYAVPMKPRLHESTKENAPPVQTVETRPTVTIQNRISKNQQNRVSSMFIFYALNPQMCVYLIVC